MCFYVPTLGAIVTSVAWNKTRSVKLWWLNLLFLGGALFGVIDHLWNGELFLISDNIVKDLMLGVTISAVILISWGIMVAASRTNPALSCHIKAREKAS